MLRPTMRIGRSFAVGWVLLFGCRPRAEVAAPAASDRVSESADYDTVIWEAPPAAVAQRFTTLQREGVAEAGTMGVVLLDRRLSQVAAAELTRPTASRAELVARARRLGSPFVPVHAMVLREPLHAGAAIEILAAVPGQGPLRVGVAAADDGSTALVFARGFFVLTQPVPRRGAQRLGFALAPPVSGFVPAALVVSAAGVERLAAESVAGAWVVAREGGFDGTVVGILGTTAAERVSHGRYADRVELFGVLRLGDAPAWPGTDGDDLVTALSSLRATWGTTPLHFGDELAPPCSQLASSVGGQPVTLTQQCIEWPSGGSDRERFAGLLDSPLAFESLARPDWHVAQLRRDPDRTSIRFARTFASRTPAQARAEIEQAILARWPAMTHDALDDAPLATLVEGWAAGPHSLEADAAIAELTAQQAGRWTPTKRWFRIAWSDQELPRLLDALAPDATPSAYALAVTRGVGSEGEPRYFVILYLALPAMDAAATPTPR